MTRASRDVTKIFGDSSEIVEVLWAWDSADGVPFELRYWLRESAVHIDGLYADACAMQRRIKRLEAKLAEASQNQTLHNGSQ